MTTCDYRILFGNEVVQIGFIPPNEIKINENLSNNVKKSYIKLNKQLSHVEILSKLETRNDLLKNNTYLQYIGPGKWRTLFKNNIKLYKSIIDNTTELNQYFTEVKLSNRILFIVNGNYDLNFIKCDCGKNYTFNKYCRYCSEPKRNMVGKHHTPETKNKIRIKSIQYITKCNGNCVPRYNLNSIKMIEDYGKVNGYIFQHAENGGEYHIKELGYFVDGYDKNKNVVIEVDEKQHFKNGNLCQEDLSRQKEIEDFLGCKFIRLKYDNK